MKKIEIKTKKEMNEKIPTTATAAKALYNSLRNGEWVIFEFSGEFSEHRKIFKRAGERLIVGDGIRGEKATWSQGFGPEDWNK